MGGTFVVLGPHRVAYLDYTGSGAESAAHLQENGRIVVMFCAFEGPPNIVRLHGRGRYVLARTPEFDELRPLFSKEREIGQRGIVVVDVDRVSDSCGYSVPFMDFVGDRDVLDRDHERREPEFFDGYWQRKNATSIDGLPGWTSPALLSAPDAGTRAVARVPRVQGSAVAHPERPADGRVVLQDAEQAGGKVAAGMEPNPCLLGQFRRLPVTGGRRSSGRRSDDRPVEVRTHDDRLLLVVVGQRRGKNDPGQDPDECRHLRCGATCPNEDCTTSGARPLPASPR
ncbi:hypothetical protein NKG05_08360 [Oerskovia sp. M15]